MPELPPDSGRPVRPGHSYRDDVRTVLVTGDTLAKEAVDLLQATGIETLFCGPYAPAEEIARVAADRQIDGLIVRHGRITESVIGASPRLKVIAKHGTGVDNIDLEAASLRGVPVLRALAANARAVAEHAIALMVALLKDLMPLDRAVRNGDWPKARYVGRDLVDTRLGLIGFGAIGLETATIAGALGMSVSVYDPYAVTVPDGIDRVTDLEVLLATSDVVSLHCPLTGETRHLMNADRLSRMKPTAFLVNTARGGVVDESALIHALRTGAIAGAGLDSFATEPPAADNPLWTLPNVIATPHTAGVTKGSVRAMAETAARHVISVIRDGAPDQRSVANPDYRTASS